MYQMLIRIRKKIKVPLSLKFLDEEILPLVIEGPPHDHIIVITIRLNLDSDRANFPALHSASQFLSKDVEWNTKQCHGTQKSGICSKASQETITVNEADSTVRNAKPNYVSKCSDNDNKGTIVHVGNGYSTLVDYLPCEASVAFNRVCGGDDICGDESELL